MNREYYHYIAVDWSIENMAIARMTAKSNKVTVIDVPSDLGELKMYLDNLRGSKIMTLEETTTSQWLYTELKDHVDRLVVCDPVRNHLLSEGAKSDKIDAQPGLSKSAATKLVRADLEALPPPEGQPVITGIGSATDAELGHTVYFATVEWPGAQKTREQLGLSPSDLHITLGSTVESKPGNGVPADVHGVSKKANIVQFADAKPGVSAKVGKQATAGKFEDGFDKFSIELSEYDAASAKQRGKKELSERDKELLASGELTELDKKRATFVKNNVQ